MYKSQDVKICLKCAKHYIQLNQKSKMSNIRQELNICWNWFHLIQCPPIGLRDIISCFYHQMPFQELILLSKMSNYMVKTSKFGLETQLTGFSTLELC